MDVLEEIKDEYEKLQIEKECYEQLLQKIFIIHISNVSNEEKLKKYNKLPVEFLYNLYKKVTGDHKSTKKDFKQVIMCQNDTVQYYNQLMKWFVTTQDRVEEMKNCEIDFIVSSSDDESDDSLFSTKRKQTQALPTGRRPSSPPRPRPMQDD